MKTVKEPVRIIIPVYKTNLDAFEKTSLARLVQVLGRHPKTIIHPRGLDLSPITDLYPDEFAT